MSESILGTTKKILGLDENYSAFDLDILTHINAAFAVVTQLGVGPAEGIVIDSEEVTWDSLALPATQLSVVRSYIYLKARMLFDPPATSFHIDAANDQIREFEFRLSVFRDEEASV